MSLCREAFVFGKMVDVVGGFKHYLLKKDEATTDNIAFRIHYRVSFTILLGCMALVSLLNCFLIRKSLLKVIGIVP